MKVFVSEPYAAEALARLQTNSSIELLSADKMTDAEILLTRSQTQVDQTLLNRLPRLKLVVTATSGFDHIDWRACQKRGVLAAFTPEANAQSTAELTMFLMMGLVRKTLSHIESAKKGRWREGLSRGDSLEGKTLGIVGLGRVGSQVAHLAHAFGMKIVAHDPYVGDSVFEKAHATRLGFIEVLRAADIVTLHVPLTKETKHLINKPTIQEMASTTFIVNASRGSAVDESELLVALRENRIAGAALDVMEREPPLKNNSLLQHPRVLITPHVGAYTESAWKKASLAAVSRVFAFLKQEPVLDTLPLQTEWFSQT